VSCVEKPPEDGGPRRPERPDLKVRKTAPAQCTLVRTSGDVQTFHCAFTVTVTNTGTVAETGEVVVTDQTYAGQIVDVQGAGWTCTASSDRATCRQPGTSLPPGGSASVQVVVEFSKTAQYDANIRNCAVLGEIIRAGSLRYRRIRIAGRSDDGFRFLRLAQGGTSPTVPDPSCAEVRIPGEPVSPPSPPPPPPRSGDVPIPPPGFVPPPGGDPRACPFPKVRIGNRCLCRDGSDGDCRTVRPEPSCPRGQVRRAGRCVPIVRTCRDGSRPVRGVCRDAKPKPKPKPKPRPKPKPGAGAKPPPVCGPRERRAGLCGPAAAPRRLRGAPPATRPPSTRPPPRQQIRRPQR
jgi:hypothetical protein